MSRGPQARVVYIHEGFAMEASLKAVRTRTDCARVPVIAVTGYAGHRENALAAGFSDFIVKPIARDALCRRVARVMET